LPQSLIFPAKPFNFALSVLDPSLFLAIVLRDSIADVVAGNGADRNSKQSARKRASGHTPDDRASRASRKPPYNGRLFPLRHRSG
jgi:hypothetical protein